MKFNIANNGTEYLYLELTNAEMTALGFDPQKHHNIISIGADSYDNKKGTTVKGVHNRTKCAVALNNFTVVDSGVVGKHGKLCLNFNSNVSNAEVEAYVQAQQMIMVAQIAKSSNLSDAVTTTIIQETNKVNLVGNGKMFGKKQSKQTEETIFDENLEKN